MPRAIWPVIQRKLDQIDSVTALDALRIPPGNRLDRLVDELAGFHAIRVNDQYQIIFRFDGRPQESAHVVATSWQRSSALSKVIESSPKLGTPISTDGHTRRALVTRFPYQVVYRLLPTEIVIGAIAHLKRRPGYWRNQS